MSQTLNAGRRRYDTKMVHKVSMKARVLIGVKNEYPVLSDLIDNTLCRLIIDRHNTELRIAHLKRTKT